MCIRDRLTGLLISTIQTQARPVRTVCGLGLLNQTTARGHYPVSYTHLMKNLFASDRMEPYNEIGLIFNRAYFVKGLREESETKEAINLNRDVYKRQISDCPDTECKS